MSGENTHRPHGEIMVVEDDEPNLKLLSAILAKAGYQVRPAGDGESALRSVRAKLPDLLLLDVNLPGMTGIEVCRRLKADPETNDFPVIFLSALGETELKVQALDAGGIDYITKPLGISEVLARINTHLNMHRLQRESIQSHAFLQTIIDALPEPTLVVNLDRTIALANLAALHGANLDKDGSPPPKTCFEAAHNRETVCDGSEHVCPLDEVVRTRKPSVVTHTHYGPEGNATLSEITAAPILDQAGEVRQIVESIRDVTERRLAEREIVDLAKFPSENPNPVLRIAGDGTVLYRNAPGTVLLKAWGWEEGKPLGGRWSEVVADVLQADKVRVDESEHEGRTYALTFTPVAEAGYVNIYALDVTEQRQAEREIREAQEQLLQQQRHETERVEEQLAEARDELIRKARLAAIGQVSGSIAHDLRNPLGSVRNAVYYLKQIIPGGESEIVEYLGIINQEVAAADRIITNLLKLGRSPMVVKQDVDLSRAVGETFDRIGPATGVRLLISADPDPFVVLADPDQLRQVLDNMVANAVQAMGGKGEIIVETARDGENDKIVFRDTGPGIAPEVRDTLFHPLVTTRARGTGLGLTICRQIVERHGGTIDVVDENRAGAAFAICLPRKTRQTSESTEN